MGRKVYVVPLKEKEIIIQEAKPAWEELVIGADGAVTTVVHEAIPEISEKIKVVQVTPEEIAEAQRLGICEVACGIPPGLKNKVSEIDLPTTFEEPDPTPTEPTRDLAKEIDEVKFMLTDHDNRLRKNLSGHTR